MFMLYAVGLGLVAGAALGGRLASLGRLQFRWAWLAIAGLWIQLILFSAPVTGVVEAYGPVVYVGSTLVVLGVVLANCRQIPGLFLVASGAASNLATIVANGGYMPATAEALAGRPEAIGYSNSVQLAQPQLELLIDRFALPGGLPFTNVFSVGDVLIGLGIIVVIAKAMIRPVRDALAPDESPPSLPNSAQRASAPR